MKALKQLMLLGLSTLVLGSGASQAADIRGGFGLVALALEPGLCPEEGPTFAAYLQARPFETRCDALVTLNMGALFQEACK